MTAHPVRVPRAAQLLLLLAAAAAFAGRASALPNTYITKTYSGLQVSYNTFNPLVAKPSSTAAPGFGAGSVKAECATAGCKQEIVLSPQEVFGTDQPITLADITCITYRTLRTPDNTAPNGDWCVTFGNGWKISNMHGERAKSDGWQFNANRRNNGSFPFQRLGIWSCTHATGRTRRAVGTACALVQVSA